MTGKKYNPAIHHRRSIRLPEYDYSQAGAYFVTLCVKDRQCLFGEITDGKMVLNEPGQMIENQWDALQQRFRNIELDSYIIMPNHFHGIIILTGNRRDESRIHPDNESSFNTKGTHQIHPDHPDNKLLLNPQGNRSDESRIHPDNKLLVNPKGEYKIRPSPNSPDSPDKQNRPKGTTEGSIGRIIQAFKSITTQEYINGVKRNGWQPFPGKLWQRNYFERVHPVR